MAETTGIEWCHATFNPWIGCEKVSPGCAHCYAETLVHGRMGRGGTWGSEGRRERTSESNWKKPLRWAKLAREAKLPDGSPNLDGHRPRIFCASLADVFEDRPELRDPRDDLFTLIEQTPELDWLLLTKRPEFARDWIKALPLGEHGMVGFTSRVTIRVRELGFAAAFPNVWLGTSIENARHTYRADVLREIPAAVRFLSCEPLLGSLYPKGVTNANLGRDDGLGHLLVPGERHQDLLEEGEAAAVRLGAADGAERAPGDHHVAASRLDLDPDLRRRQHRAPLDLTGIDWVIVGGGACLDSPFACDFCRLGRGEPSKDGCETHWAPCSRPAFFFKQWGEWAPAGVGDLLNTRISTAVRPSGQTVMPGHIQDGDELVVRIGKKQAGRHLDGRTWSEFPTSAAVPA